jgi:hypothetical protein
LVSNNSKKLPLKRELSHLSYGISLGDNFVFAKLFHRVDIKRNIS